MTHDEDEQDLVFRRYLRHGEPSTVTYDDLLAQDSTDTEKNLQVGIFIATRSFLRSNDPIEGIRSLLRCHQAGVYPPEAVMDLLCGALNTWWDSGGRTSVESALGVAAAGPGKESSLQVAIRGLARSDLMVEMNQLLAMFGMSRSKAGGMISARLEAIDCLPPPMVAYDPTTLVRWWNEDSKHFKDALGQQTRAHFRELPVSEKRERLKAYPPYSYRGIRAIAAILETDT